MNLIKYSNSFKFKSNIHHIEYCLSMINIDNDLLLSYQYDDNSCFLKKYNIDKLNKVLEWKYPDIKLNQLN
jgi:hypothetical protein